MDELWITLEHWLEQHLPEVLADLNPGCSNEELDDLERCLECTLPEDLKAFYRRHNGQAGATTGLFCGLPFLSASEVYEQWLAWRTLAEEFEAEAEEFDEASLATEITGESYPVDAIKLVYINLKWIPFAHDDAGNHLGIDLDPDTQGTNGQVINFGTDENNKFVIASSFKDFVAWVIAQYQRGNYQQSDRSLNLLEPAKQHFLDAVPLLFGKPQGMER